MLFVMFAYIGVGCDYRNSSRQRTGYTSWGCQNDFGVDIVFILGNSIIERECGFLHRVYGRSCVLSEGVHEYRVLKGARDFSSEVDA